MKLKSLKEKWRICFKKLKGRRMADMNTVRYCGRYDIFMDRMQTYLTDELIETVKFYTELV